jgi:hypothetical protein
MTYTVEAGVEVVVVWVVVAAELAVCVLAAA